MEIFMKAKLNLVEPMVTDIFKPIMDNTVAHLKIMWDTVTVNKKLNKYYSKVFFSMEKENRVKWNIMMGIFTKDNFKITYLMVREH